RVSRDWSSDVGSSDLGESGPEEREQHHQDQDDQRSGRLVPPPTGGRGGPYRHLGRGGGGGRVTARPGRGGGVARWRPAVGDRRRAGERRVGKAGTPPA